MFASYGCHLFEAEITPYLSFMPTCSPNSYHTVQIFIPKAQKVRFTLKDFILFQKNNLDNYFSMVK